MMRLIGVSCTTVGVGVEMKTKRSSSFVIDVDGRPKR